ncbi:ribosome assembly cofactor RimP [Robiginitalea sp. IMCC43444]|uniref:ribosome assembly cofactor RimP n=1 Tax=Robiginitalea sp. IMCC43444 TaxID=3459121 RepID=UPI004041DF8A
MAGTQLEEKVKELLDDAFAEKPNLFLLELTILPDQTIRVIIDGDEGVNLQDCMDVSRAIEHSLDRDEYDFSLEVSSAGATQPLELPRQYPKHIGRTLEVQTAVKTVKGTLTATSESGITLNWKTREPKPVGKGKHTVKKEAKIPFADIEQAKVVLKF